MAASQWRLSPGNIKCSSFCGPSLQVTNIQNSIKPFLPFLLTFLGPRALAYYRAVRTAIRTRPPPKTLSAATSRGLNVLFFSICIFFFLSLPIRKGSFDQNIFTATKSRLHIPTDVLFARLSSLRPGGGLSPMEETLRAKLTTPLHVNPNQPMEQFF